MAPGLPKKQNRSSSSVQAQREHASSMLKRNTLLDGPRPTTNGSQGQERKRNNLSSFIIKGASSSARTQTLMKTYKEVVDDMDHGGKNTTDTHVPSQTGMKKTSTAPQELATPSTTTPHLDGAQPTQMNEEGSPLGTAASEAVENLEEEFMDQNDISLITKKRGRGVTRGLGSKTTNLLKRTKNLEKL